MDIYDGYAIYNIRTPVTVLPNTERSDALVSQMLNDNPGSSFLNELKGGNLQKCAENVINLANALNNMAYITSSNLNTSNSTYLTTVSMPRNTTTLNWNSSSNATLSPTEEIKNQRSRGREMLLSKVNTLSRSDVSSIKLFSSMLSTVTKKFEENSRTISVSTFLIIYYQKF